MEKIKFLASSLIAVSLATTAVPLTAFADTTSNEEGSTQSQVSTEGTIFPSVIKKGFYILY
ncbi:MAG: hypothetical protein ABF808_08690 [Oenococcus sp.]|uniref:hypothetical protein n=1 Tax=Oenococcus sp. TaxID=1979414 RepID=UPI0039E8C776